MKTFPDKLYALTDSTLCLGRPTLEVVASLLAADIKIIQYREKHKSAKDMLAECLAIRDLTHKAGALFIVNDHVDLAILCQADGVHIGQDDLPVPAVRQLVGESVFIGLSTHSPAQATQAALDGADYIGVGPIFATQTKACDPVGLTYLDWVVANLKIPFVAIGGIKQHNIAEVMAHGAKCCALVSELVGAKDIVSKVAEVRAAMPADA